MSKDDRELLGDYIDIVDKFEEHLSRKYHNTIDIGGYEALESDALLKVFPYVYICELIKYIREEI